MKYFRSEKNKKNKRDRVNLQEGETVSKLSTSVLPSDNKLLEFNTSSEVKACIERLGSQVRLK